LTDFEVSFPPRRFELRTIEVSKRLLSSRIDYLVGRSDDPARR
jgi:hypothetical protein